MNGDCSFLLVYSLRARLAKQEKTDVLTAFVAIALHQSTEFCKHQILQHSLNQAVNFLKGRIPNIQSPYTLAIVAYALELIQPGSESARNAAQRLYTYADIKDDVIYWALDGKMAAGSIETTSYALMYTVLIKDWHNSKKIASWLASKRQYAGGFFSTQDTTTALNALTDYEMQAADPELDLHISITDQFTDVEQRKIHHIFDIKKKNAVDVQGSEIPLGGNLIVTVGHHGNGLGTLSFQRSYNAFETGPEEKAYKMSVTVKKKEEEGFPMGRIGWFDARQRAKRSAGEAFNNIYSITLIIRQALFSYYLLCQRR
uniref:Alpha-macroglobulin-like TED domain-containing protein n=1 Tax=Eptatretus burgeri TaxID=7764 RepID=A0A8C4QZT7_EPTBU